MFTSLELKARAEKKTSLWKTIWRGGVEGGTSSSWYSPQNLSLLINMKVLFENILLKIINAVQYVKFIKYKCPS
jgi:hypothetical protein